MSRSALRAAREVVTAQYFRDPPPTRAGRSPDCEEARRREESDEAYRLLNREPPVNGYAYLNLADVREKLERLAPRRYSPKL